MAAPDDEYPVLRVRLEADLEAVRLVREATNVVLSYTHAVDILAEALQNALDALDENSERFGDAPRRIDVEFDARAKRLSVTDTGTGMSQQALRVVLAPHVTNKEGELAPARSRRSRGEKGVGLSFLMFVSNRLSIQTCDGTRRVDLEVANANAWLREPRTVQEPRARVWIQEADELLGSPTYTRLTLSEIDIEQFDEDLFAKERDQLVWDLRTRTAVGNTAPLFAELDRPQSDDVTITLHYTDVEGVEHEAIRVPYLYATPAELLEDDDIEVVDFEDIEDLDPDDQQELLEGQALRYVREWRSASGRQVDLYVFAFDGREMNELLRERRKQGRWVPDTWQGFFLATRDMPTGIGLRSGLIQPRSYERRLFGLLQYDGLSMDLGRKTVAGRLAQMFQSVIRGAWNQDLSRPVIKLSRPELIVSKADRAALGQTIRSSRAREDLGIKLPYWKIPEEATGVMALFHELLASPDFELPLLRTLISAPFRSTDALMYVGQPNGTAPLHVLFAVGPEELVHQLERDERGLATVDMAVIWRLPEDELANIGVEAEVLTQPGAATHRLLLYGHGGGRETLPVLVLEHRLRRGGA